MHVGLRAVITSSAKEILAADAVILPGVGAYRDAMETLRRLDLASVIRDVAASPQQLFGICLGMQLLMSESEEYGRHKGLGIIPGRVVKLPAEENDQPVKVPQIGWTAVRRPRSARASTDPWRGSLLDGVDDGEPMYFVHSYFVSPERDDVVLSISTYGVDSFCSSLVSGNVMACQFHPERSGKAGLHLYRNLAKLISSESKGETL
jgi:imidazole glycerol-phosphate synthase subunit HisH